MTTTLETSIRAKTRDLCESILQQPEFGELRLKIDQFLVNDAARQQYQELTEQGEYLHHKQHQGVQLTKEEVEGFEKKREAFMKNPVARGFMDAQDQAFQMRDIVAKYVSKTFELGRVPTEEDLGEGGCGEGCGCH
ncbi:MAG TPA: hypothetical protein DCY13_21180 [Verrucomicrobiales bacterium]|jgi:cell fate (sporulation/competence/biofilm development) regulator YlbF (YheA/YmcA/DUF963 family)|nr:hypothetical protein [Verrucomicrobiales bacterium]